MKTFLNIVSLVVSVLFVIIFLLVFLMYFYIPLLNEERLEKALDPLFMKFQSITSEKYHFKEDKEVAFQEVLDKKARIVNKETFPLISCRAVFVAHNPGTIYRNDVRKVSCSWKN